MNSVRHTVYRTSHGTEVHLNALWELLMLAPPDFADLQLDQNRYYFMPGFTHRYYSVMAGYYARVLPPSTETRILNHGLCVWMFWNF